MNDLFERLQALALDPFAQQRTRPLDDVLIDAQRALAAGPSQVANGPWAQCEGCCDPGPDEFPEQNLAL